MSVFTQLIFLFPYQCQFSLLHSLALLSRIDLSDLREMAYNCNHINSCTYWSVVDVVDLGEVVVLFLNAHVIKCRVNDTMWTEGQLVLVLNSSELCVLKVNSYWFLIVVNFVF